MDTNNTEEVKAEKDTKVAKDTKEKNKFFHKQFKQKICDSFKLTTHKITLTVLFLALTVLISLLEIPTFFSDFLSIDFGITINLLAIYIIQLPYALLIAVIAPWLRLIIPHTMPPNVIGELANMLSSISTLLVFFLVNSLFWLIANKGSSFKERLLLNNIKDSNWKLRLTIDICSAVVTVVTVSLLNTFYNWAFILDLYGAVSLKSLLWTLFLPYNLFKFTLVFILFCLLKKPTLTLKNQFNL